MVSYFSDETFFCSAEPKKGFCRRRFCCWVKRRAFKGFCRIFYPFFGTLDAFVCVYLSAEPFWGVRQTFFIFFRVAVAPGVGSAHPDQKSWRCHYPPLITLGFSIYNCNGSQEKRAQCESLGEKKFVCGCQSENSIG